MEPKSNRWILFTFIMLFLTAGAFSAGILVDHFFLKKSGNLQRLYPVRHRFAGHARGPVKRSPRKP